MRKVTESNEMGDKNSNAKGVSPHLIGVGVAMLSALAAEGKDFDRDELNAMLDLSEH